MANNHDLELRINNNLPKGHPRHFNLAESKHWIFDLDGTLYSLEPVQKLLWDKAVDFLHEKGPVLPPGWKNQKKQAGSVIHLDEMFDPSLIVDSELVLDRRTGYLLDVNLLPKESKNAKRHAQILNAYYFENQHGEPRSINVRREYPNPIIEIFDNDKYYITHDMFGPTKVVLESFVLTHSKDKKAARSMLDTLDSKLHRSANVNFKKHLYSNALQYGIKPNPELIKFLKTRAEEGKIFYLLTNSEIRHAETMLGILGLSELFPAERRFRHIDYGDKKLLKPASLSMSMDLHEHNMELLRRSGNYEHFEQTPIEYGFGIPMSERSGIVVFEDNGLHASLAGKSGYGSVLVSENIDDEIHARDSLRTPRSKYQYAHTDAMISSIGVLPKLYAEYQKRLT